MNPWDNNSGDKDEFISQLQDAIKRKKKEIFNNNKGFKVNPLWIALLGIGLWFSTGFYTVKPDEQGVVLRFGKWVRSTNPGLNYCLPYPFERVIIQSVTNIRRIDVGFKSFKENDDQSENLMLTGDSNLANVSFTVLWKIKHGGVEEFLFNARSPELAVRACSESVMRSAVGKNAIVYVQTEGRSEIASEVKEELQKLLDEYNTGVEIVQVNLQNVEPPFPVIDSFRDVERAQADQQKSVNEADAYKRNLLANARGESAEILNNAEGRKQAMIAEAKGAVSRFLSVYQEYKMAKDIISKRIYFDTMKEIIKSSNLVLIDEKNGVLPHTSF